MNNISLRDFYDSDAGAQLAQAYELSSAQIVTESDDITLPRSVVANVSKALWELERFYKQKLIKRDQRLWLSNLKKEIDELVINRV